MSTTPVRVIEKPKAGQLRAVDLVPEIKIANESQRLVTFTSSTEAPDRYGDIIRVRGWELDNYTNNPIVLWGHKSKEPPIGMSEKVRKDMGLKPALVNTVRFMTKDVYPFADTIYKMLIDKTLRACSVGFRPLEDPTPIKDNEGMTTGYEYTNQELLELSVVPIPANQEALARAIQKGYFSGANEVDAWLKQVKGLCGDENPAWTNMVPGVTYSLETNEKDAKEESVEETEDKAAVDAVVIEREQSAGSTRTRVVFSKENCDMFRAINERVETMLELCKKLAEAKPPEPTVINISSGTRVDSSEVLALLDKAHIRPSGTDEDPKDDPNDQNTPIKMDDLAMQIHDHLDDALGSVVEGHKVLGKLSDRIDNLKDESVESGGDESLPEGAGASFEAVIRALSGTEKEDDYSMADMASDLHDHLDDCMKSIMEAHKAHAALSDRIDNLKDDSVVIPDPDDDDGNDDGDEEGKGAQAEEKSVVPYKADPIAPKGTAWDAGKEMGKQTAPSGWKRMSTIVTGEPRNKGSYKLPHHMGSGFQVNRNGVRAALGRLNQTQASPADRAGARSHLTKHQKAIADADKSVFDSERFERILAWLDEKYQEAVATGVNALVETAQYSIDRHIDQFIPVDEKSETVTDIIDELVS